MSRYQVSQVDIYESASSSANTIAHISIHLTHVICRQSVIKHCAQYMSVPRHIEHHSTRDSWNNLPTAPAVIASRCFGDCCGGNSPAKRERHCCMLREPTVVSQNYVGRLKFIVVFMGTFLLHKEMDKCWNTHPGKTNHLGQNHGGMIVGFIPCRSDPFSIP